MDGYFFYFEGKNDHQHGVKHVAQGKRVAKPKERYTPLKGSVSKCMKKIICFT